VQPYLPVGETPHSWLDYGMPRVSAGSLVAAPVALIALTGWGQDGDRQRASDAGFDRHMTKPVEPGVLEALLANGNGR
jgi:CheY-like chemotaxis protein